MKKLVVLMVIFLFSINLVLASNCQYTDRIEYTEQVNVFFENDELLDYNILEVKNIRKTPDWNDWDCLFEVHNNYGSAVNVSINYSVMGEAKSVNKIIDRKDSVLIVDTYKEVTGSYNPVQPCLDNERAVFMIHSPEYLEVRVDTKTYEKVVCKDCPENSGLWCINDGAYADSDDRCGSGMRNLTGNCTAGSDAYAPCPKHTFEDKDGVCVPDKHNPPTGMAYCNKEFKKIGVLEPGKPCTCSFECINHYFCKDKQCFADRTNPPIGKEFCNGEFRIINSASLNENCSCSFECKEGVCIGGLCSEVIDAGISCVNNTNIGQGDWITCNFRVDNIKLGTDAPVRLELDPGPGLLFNKKDCDLLKGKKCVITRNVSKLKEGINLELSAEKCGISNPKGQAFFEFEGKEVSSEMHTHYNIINVYCCGDGNVDPGEDKYSCCVDAGVDNYSFFKLTRELCKDNQYSREFNWSIIIIGVLIMGFTFIILYFLRQILSLAKKKFWIIGRTINELFDKIKIFSTKLFQKKKPPSE